MEAAAAAVRIRVLLGGFGMVIIIDPFGEGEIFWKVFKMPGYRQARNVRRITAHGLKSESTRVDLFVQDIQSVQ
jgi:hypothetical protein